MRVEQHTSTDCAEDAVLKTDTVRNMNELGRRFDSPVPSRNREIPIKSRLAHGGSIKVNDSAYYRPFQSAHS